MQLITQALSGAVLVLSAILAFRLGITWGLTDWERWIYGSIVVLFEALKCLLPFAIVAAWRDKRMIGAALAAILFTGLVALSFLGTLGFAELNRGALAGSRAQAVAEIAVLRRESAALRQRLDALPPLRSLPELDSEIDTILRSVVKGRSDNVMLGTRTSDCAKVSSQATIEPCMRVGQLRRERAERHERERLEAELATKRFRLSQASGLDLAGIADPHVAVIAKLSGLSADAARLAANIAFATLLELVGGLGFFLATLFSRPAPASPVAEPQARQLSSAAAEPIESDLDAANRYLATEVCRDVTGFVTASAMHRDYTRWCATERVTPLTLTAFGLLVSRQGIGKVKVEGLVRYRNVALKSTGLQS